MKKLLLISLIAFGCAHPDKDKYVSRYSFDSLCAELKEQRVKDSIRFDKLEFQVEAYRRVIKMHGKSINGIIKHDVAQDSIIDKEIKNVGLTKKIGKTLLSLTLGAIGL